MSKISNDGQAVGIFNAPPSQIDNVEILNEIVPAETCAVCVCINLCILFYFYLFRFYLFI